MSAFTAMGNGNRGTDTAMAQKQNRGLINFSAKLTDKSSSELFKDRMEDLKDPLFLLFWSGQERLAHLLMEWKYWTLS